MSTYFAVVLSVLALFFGVLWLQLIAHTLRDAVAARRHESSGTLPTGEGVNS